MPLPPERTPPEILDNPDWFPYFKNCIGAIDGSHIPAHVPSAESDRYRNRKGFLSQNVFAACTFDLCFCYVLAGWEGCAHDAKVLEGAQSSGFDIPEGKYYLGDAGYGLSLSVLTPYRGIRYHLQEYKRSSQRYVPVCGELLGRIDLLTRCTGRRMHGSFSTFVTPLSGMH
jgi:hypothetical protein